MAAKNEAPEISEFYIACRDGHVKFVEDYLKTHSAAKYDLNTLEPSVNSTPLHAASSHGHTEIVELLIRQECDRSLTNGDGLTAYEMAANDKIRQLFHRPNGTQRFHEENMNQCFDFLKGPKEEKADKEDTKEEKAPAPVFSIPVKKQRKPGVQSYMTEVEKDLEIGHATTSIALCQSKLGRMIADLFQRDAPMSLVSIGNKLQDIIDKEVIANKDPQSQKATELLKKFLNDESSKGVQHLIRLYTLETKFYAALKNNPIPLAVPMFMTADELKERYFQGQSYRGANITQDEIDIYESVAKSPGSLLQIKNFTSTSVKRSVAEEFVYSSSHKPNSNKRCPAVLVFNFPEHCEQAINLGRISDTQPCLSEFENEDEILILPWTLFEVERIHKEPGSSYEIHLTNVSLPHKSLWSSVAWILTHPISCIKRFYEHFPAKEPETVVQHIANTVSPADENILKEDV